MTAGPDASETHDPERTEQEPFLSRWSRLKQEAGQPAREPVPSKTSGADEPAPELPPLDQLTPASDYRVFFHPKVDEDVRRAALKRLFSDPHFNVMDGLDTYIDDYSKTEPIPAAMLAQLRQAQNILQWAKEDEEKRAKDRLRQEASAPALDAPAAQPAPGAEVAANTPESVPASTDDAGAGGQSRGAA